MKGGNFCEFFAALCILCLSFFALADNEENLSNCNLYLGGNLRFSREGLSTLLQPKYFRDQRVSDEQDYNLRKGEAYQNYWTYPFKFSYRWVDIDEQQKIYFKANRDLSTELRKELIRTKNGKTQIKVLIPDYFNQDQEFKTITDIPAKEYSTHWGFFITSHSTYLQQPKYPDKDVLYYIKYGGREASIYMSEFISMELAGKYGLGYFPESLYFSIPMQKYNDDQKEKNANNQIRRYLPLVFREGEPKNVEINENEELIPLYSFLASPKLTLVAEKMGVTVEEWLLQEYLPKLAHWHARLNFEHGIYIEGHGQNTSAIVNFATGNVVGFVFRDMYDVALDASYRIIKGMEPAVPLKANLSIINSFHVSSRHDRKEEVFTAGELFWEFQMQVVQGILDHPITGKFSQKCVKRFLEEYKSATSQLTGVHIADFNYAKYSYDLKSLVFDSVNTIRDTVVASLKPSIFKYMRVRYKKDILEKILYTSRLVPIFAKYFTLIENGKVDEFKYFFNGTSLAIWSKSEKRPVGYVHSLNDEEKSKLIKLSLGIAL